MVKLHDVKIKEGDTVPVAVVCHVGYGATVYGWGSDLGVFSTYMRRSS
jgi:DNA gyrase inhibitor GyrI